MKLAKMEAQATEGPTVASTSPMDSLKRHLAAAHASASAPASSLPYLKRRLAASEAKLAEAEAKIKAGYIYKKNTAKVGNKKKLKLGPNYEEFQEGYAATIGTQKSDTGFGSQMPPNLRCL